MYEEERKRKHTAKEIELLNAIGDAYNVLKTVNYIIFMASEDLEDHLTPPQLYTYRIKMDNEVMRQQTDAIAGCLRIFEKVAPDECFIE